MMDRHHLYWESCWTRSKIYNAFPATPGHSSISLSCTLPPACKLASFIRPRCILATPKTPPSLNFEYSHLPYAVMDELITRQIRGKKPEEVTKLVLDNARCNAVAGLTTEFSSLHHLSIVNAGLVSLDSFPPLPSLKELQLDDNKLSGGLKLLEGCTALSRLGLAGNKISDLEDLKPLRSLTKLTSLDLFNCPVTSLTEYRSQVFQLLPSLKSLDGLNEKGEEVDSEGEEEDEEEVDEEEEEEEEEEDEEEDGPGLDYLLNSELRSDSEEGDYDPDQDVPDSKDEEESSDEDDTGAGPSSSKKPKLEETKDVQSSDTD